MKRPETCVYIPSEGHHRVRSGHSAPLGPLDSSQLGAPPAKGATRKSVETEKKGPETAVCQTGYNHLPTVFTTPALGNVYDPKGSFRGALSDDPEHLGAVTCLRCLHWLVKDTKSAPRLQRDDSNAI